MSGKGRGVKGEAHCHLSGPVFQHRCHRLINHYPTSRAENNHEQTPHSPARLPTKASIEFGAI